MNLLKRFLYCILAWSAVAGVSLVCRSNSELTEQELTRVSNPEHERLVVEEEDIVLQEDNFENLKEVSISQIPLSITSPSETTPSPQIPKSRSREISKTKGFEAWRRDLNPYNKKILKRLMKKENNKELHKDVEKAREALRAARRKHKKKAKERLTKIIETDTIS